MNINYNMDLKTIILNNQNYWHIIFINKNYINIIGLSSIIEKNEY